MITNKLSRPIAELRGSETNQLGAVSSGKISGLAQQMKRFFTLSNKELQDEQDRYFDSLKRENLQRDIYHKEILLVIIQATTKKKFGEQKIKEKVGKKAERKVKKEEKPTEAPATKTQAPAPKVEAPTPKTQAPPPKAEAPAPKVTAKKIETKTAAPPTAAPAPPAIGGAAKTAAKIIGGAALGAIATKEAFAQTMLPQAERASQKMSGGKIPPEALVAQWALESGWGKSLTGDYNYFGTKADKSWKGDKKLVTTTEVFTDQQAKQFVNMGEGREILSVGGAGEKPGTKRYKVKDWFRSYKSLDEAVDDKANFLLKNPRYRKAGVLDAKTPEEYFKSLQASGYATDETYASKLLSVVPSVKRAIVTKSPDTTLLPPQRAETLDSMTKENIDMKKDMSKTPGGVVIMQQNNNTTKQETTIISPKRSDNINPILR